MLLGPKEELEENPGVQLGVNDLRHGLAKLVRVCDQLKRFESATKIVIAFAWSKMRARVKMGEASCFCFSSINRWQRKAELPG